MKTTSTYFKVITLEDTKSADILLYGVIGQDLWWDKERKEESITDIEFVKTFRELEKKYDRINIRINSPGGSIHHGKAIINTIRNSKVDVHTYIDGTAASMAADIWLAAKNRHMAIDSMLMIHSNISGVWGTAKEMRAEADILDKMDEAAISFMAKATGMSEKAVKEAYYDYQDHWITAKEAAEIGLIDQVDTYEAKAAIQEVEKMTFPQLVQHFQKQGGGEEVGWLQKMAERIQGVFSKRKEHVKSNSSNTKSTRDMTKDELRKSLQDGDLTMEDLVKEIEAGDQYEITQKATPKQEEGPSLEEIVKQAVEAATKPLNEEITKLQGQVKQLGDQPGDDPTKAAGGEDPGNQSPAMAAYMKTVKEMAETVNNGQNPFVH